MADASGLDWKGESIGMLATNLHMHDQISTELLQNLMILSRTLNRAVHGEQVTIEQSQRSLETGRKVLAKLDGE